MIGEKVIEPLRWPDPEIGPWDLKVTLVATPTGIKCTELDIRLLPGQEGTITARLLQQIRFGAIARKWADEWAQQLRAWSANNERMAEDLDRAAGGQRSRTRGDYEQVAAVYRGAVAHGNPRAAVAQAFAVSPDTAATWIHRARKAGVLGPAPRRGSSGELLSPGKSAARQSTHRKGDEK